MHSPLLYLTSLANCWAGEGWEFTVLSRFWCGTAEFEFWTLFRRFLFYIRQMPPANWSKQHCVVLCKSGRAVFHFSCRKLSKNRRFWPGPNPWHAQLRARSVRHKNAADRKDWSLSLIPHSPASNCTFSPVRKSSVKVMLYSTKRFTGSIHNV